MIPRRVGLLACVSGAGLVAGHALNYLLLAPDASHRETLLAATGHGWLRAAVFVAPAVAVVSALATLAIGAASRRHAGPSLVALAVPLAAAQSVAFVVLELVERLLAEGALHHLTPQLLVVGVFVQVAVALAGAAAIVLLDRAGGLVARAFTTELPQLRRLVCVVPPQSAPASIRSHELRAFRRRGPPFPLAV